MLETKLQTLIDTLLPFTNARMPFSSERHIHPTCIQATSHMPSILFDPLAGRGYRLHITFKASQRAQVNIKPACELRVSRPAKLGRGG